ncbi:MAG TPA: hypothetical protein PK718_06100 [Candidatus Methanofastidiosa archaeon]|nr:hypothetical protein [Candidatus Methanofastidiosa archaeon]
MIDTFIPGAITGFFVIHDSVDIDLAGTTGFSICMSQGLRMRIVAIPSKLHRARYYTNGRKTSIPISEHVYDSSLGYLKEAYDMTFLYRPQVAIGAGFGMSGATALGTAYSISRLQPSIDYGLLAYRAEAHVKGGYGDVVSQMNGGAMLRLAPGINSKVIQIEPGAHKLVCAVFGPLSTKSILGDSALVERINGEGSRCLEKAMEDKRIETMMRLSNRFSNKVSLATPRLMEAIDSVTSVNTMPASMSMLGESLFTLALDEDIPAILDVLDECDAELIVTDVWRAGIEHS